MTTILCYGDSNTHGTMPFEEFGVRRRHLQGSRWPDTMAAALGPRYQVIAEGLPGRTTVHEDLVEGGKRSGLDVLPAILHSHEPIDLLILMLGTNDLKPRFSVTAFEIARSVERLVILSRQLLPSLPILLFSPAPVREVGTLAEVFAGAETRQIGLPGHLRDVADRQGCGFLDVGLHVDVSPVDGVHWEGELHRTFGAVAADAVRAQMEGGE
ncbi:SGNH/GDSL hydrolase family protein [Maritalea mobilis]|uniref:SGNH/GDSL hydrolase family protein n=1 Tax=Maritalea mobilis TaxID=483324 RepID=UPI001C96EB0D|nr:SGNH/GDSL hydrolase family protein [Maritalea mobilis]MBY6202532.1 SGNH/GDSL hydrolase family protein [Maritalea mobilis]